MSNARLLAVLSLLVACGGEESGDPPLYPANYSSTYQEARNCRFSLDHDLMLTRITAAPDALDTYTSPDAPFAPGAIVIKEQYDGGDTDCTGPIYFITVMRRTESEEGLGWEWQEIDVETGRTTADQDTKR